MTPTSPSAGVAGVLATLKSVRREVISEGGRDELDQAIRTVEAMAEAATAALAEYRKLRPEVVFDRNAFDRLESQLAALGGAAPAKEGDEWRCFHCNEVFLGREAAAIHFGAHESQTPACQIDVEAYRQMEAQQARYNEEDADVHRAMYRMQGEHQVALRRAEETGYARGLRDSGKCPCAAPAAPKGGEGTRFFIEHGVVHDRTTGQHVGAAFEDDSADRLLTLLHSLENDRDAWRMTAKAMGAPATPAGGGEVPTRSDWLAERIQKWLDAVVGVTETPGGSMCEAEDILADHGEQIIAAIRASQGMPAGGGDAVDLIVRDVAALGRCTKAEDWSEAMIVTPNELRRILVRRLASTGSAPAPSAVPEGFVLVPVEPTMEQFEAAMRDLGWCDEDVEAARRNPERELCTERVAYCAMVAAAPTQEPQG